MADNRLCKKDCLLLQQFYVVLIMKNTNHKLKRLFILCSCLFFPQFINSNSLLLAQSSELFLYKDNEEIVGIYPDTTFCDTVLMDSVNLITNHNFAKRLYFWDQIKQDTTFFYLQSDYFKHHGFCPYHDCFSYRDYLKILTHNKTIIVMEPSGTGIYRISHCKINGFDVDLLLDTGSATVSISQKLEQELSNNKVLDPSDYHGEEWFRSADGKIYSKKIVFIRDFEIGGIHLNNVKASISEVQNAPLLLGQSVLSKLLAYTIIGDRFIIYKDNPNYDQDKVINLVNRVANYFHSGHGFANAIHYTFGGYRIMRNFDELKESCEQVIKELLELERMCDLDAMHLLHLATCYYEIGDYEKCIQTCSRYLYAYTIREDPIFQRMNTTVYSLITKSLYYSRANFETILPNLIKIKEGESFCDTMYYRDIMYFSAICNYYLEDYSASESDLKHAIKDCQFNLSNSFGYRIEDSVLLSKMFFDFSLWSYEIGEKKHGDGFMRHSCCMNNSSAYEFLVKHPAFYSHSCWEGESRLRIYDLFLSADEGLFSTPLVGNGTYLIKIGRKGYYGHYLYNRNLEMILFDE